MQAIVEQSGNVTLVSSGNHKAVAILALIDAGLINNLVIDSHLADELIRLKQSRDASNHQL